MTHKAGVSNSAVNFRLNYLDNMRAGAIVMVVIIHSMGYCGELDPGRRDVIDFIVHTIAVPVFFLVDGYLAVQIYRNKKAFVYKLYVQKSFFRLMVPWIIFTIIYTSARYLFEYAGVLQDQLIVGHSAREVARAMYGSVYAPQLYFLFSLFIVRLSLPLVLQVIRYGRAMLFVLFCLYLFFYKDAGGFFSPYLRVEGGQDPLLHALWGAQFYLFGVLLMLYEDLLRPLYRWIIPLALAGIVVLKVGIFFDLGKYIVQYCYLVGYFAIFFVLRQSEMDFTAVGKKTMGIYLLHAPVLMKVVALIVLRFNSNGLLSLFLISFLCFIISYKVTDLIVRIPHGKILFGLR